MKAIKVSLLFPQYHNDGSPVSASGEVSMLSRIANLCGGYTQYQIASGVYRMADGAMAEDRCLPVFVILDWEAFDTGKLLRLKALVTEYGRELGQESMYWETQQVEVEFLLCGRGSGMNCSVTGV